MAKEPKCSFCGEVGHYHTFCRSKPKKPIGTVTDVTKQWKQKNGIKEVKATEPIKPRQKKQSLAELLRLTEIVFNKWIRDRDKGKNGYFTCMCCGDKFPNEEMDAGHMFAKTYASMRFHEDNVWGQSIKCNRLEYGNEKMFKKRVKAFIGDERFEELLKIKFTPKKWDREELLEIIKKYKL